MKITIILMSILTQLSFSTTVLSRVSEANGKLIFVKGTVEINKHTAKTGSKIHFGDTVVVKSKSYAIIKVFPGTLLKLKPHTIVQIKKPQKSKDSKFSIYTYALKTGDLFIKAKTTKENRYRVIARNAILGVRGTTFFVSSAPNKKNIWMCVHEGIVKVTPHSKSKHSVHVTAGQGVVINSNKLPEVKQYGWTKELNWKFKGKLKDIKDETNIQDINYDLKNFVYD